MKFANLFAVCQTPVPKKLIILYAQTNVDEIELIQGGQKNLFCSKNKELGNINIRTLNLSCRNLLIQKLRKLGK